MKILITGADGQLGKSLRNIVLSFPQYEWCFKNSKDLNITDNNAVQKLFIQEGFEYCINCAAYTAVDKVEQDKDLAFLVNAIGPKYLAENCENTNCVLIHISTDFVFDGLKTSPYTELDETNPINEYGKSKLKGEENVKKNCFKHFILRTSWVYSEFGNNFLKTMLRLSTEKSELSIVCDQIGTPTYAGDLADVILYLIKQNIQEYGIYHYSNEGITSWYDFAVAIFDESNNDIKISPIKTDGYPTPAKRPSYSVLDKTKLKQLLGITIPYWRNSLREAYKNLQSTKKV